MKSRIGILAGAAILVAGGTYIGAYQVQDKKMPDALFTIIVLSCLVVLVLAIPAWFWLHIGEPIWTRIRHLRLIDTEKPNPYQWLLDIAEYDARNPQAKLLVRSLHVRDTDLKPETRRPWLDIEATFFNGGVHTILVGPIEGWASHNSNELADKVESKGRSRLERGTSTGYVFRIYVPSDVAKAIYAEEISIEVSRSFRRIRSLDLSKVRVNVKSEPIGSAHFETSSSLADQHTIFVGDTN